MNKNTELPDETVPVAECWNLKLYIAGQTPKSVSAFNNLKRLCEQHLKGKYKLEIIDLLANPHLAQADQIVAIPTLIRQLPAPIRKIIGDLSNSEKTLRGLDLTVQPLPEEISDGRR